MTTPPPDYGDVVVLGYIAVFGLLCAVLVTREGRLGWAFFLKNVTYALAFAWGAVSTLNPGMSAHWSYDLVRNLIRAAIVLALTWAAGELIYARYLLWRKRGMDPRIVVGRRERVVGRREDVATWRENVVTSREEAVDIEKKET